jgi:hypothetical protein
VSPTPSSSSSCSSFLLDIHFQALLWSLSRCSKNPIGINFRLIGHFRCRRLWSAYVKHPKNLSNELHVPTKDVENIVLFYHVSHYFLFCSFSRHFWILLPIFCFTLNCLIFLFQLGLARLHLTPSGSAHLFGIHKCRCFCLCLVSVDLTLNK